MLLRLAALLPRRASAAPSGDPGHDHGAADDRSAGGSRLGGVTLILMSVGALMSWVTRSQPLTAIDARFVPMSPNTAALFLILGASLYLLTEPFRHARLLARCAIVAAFVIAGAHLGQYAFGGDFGVDRWTVAPVLETIGGPPARRLTLFASLSFVLACPALLAQSFPRRPRFVGDLAGLLALLVILLAVVFALGYLYQAPRFYGDASIPMTLPTSIAFVVLGLSITIPLARRERDERRGRERDRAYADLARQALVFETIGDAVIVMDLTGRIRDWNPAAERLFGYTRAEILGRPAVTLHDPRLDGRLEVRIQESLRREHRWAGELPFQRKDGSRGVADVVVVAQLDQRGQPVAWIGVNRDITERHRADAALADSRTLLTAAEELAHVGSWAVDLATGELTWSDELFRIFGHEPLGGIVSREWFLDHVRPEDRASVRAAFARLLTEGDAQGVECRITRPDGAVRTIQSRGRLQRDATGMPHRVLGSTQDVTERNELEDQLRQSQRLEAVGQLAGGIAHDFNNLLTVVTSYAALLLQDLAADDPRRTDIEEIAKAASRAASLTQQLLAFGRRQLLQPRVLDVNHTVAEMEKMLRRLLSEHIELVTTLDPDLRPVRADPGQLEQVLMNLVVNARDAMPAGGRLTIETSNVWLDPASAPTHADGATAGAYVRLAVSDSGFGMDEATQARIFEPFFTTKEAGKGTGLGLSTVYGIVNQSGGYVTCRSAPDRGTTFEVHLPHAEAEAAALAPPRAPIFVAPRGAETVLLVEDDEAVRSVARRILGAHDYAVVEAPNGTQALRWYDETLGRVDIVVTDMVMPEMSGSELVRHLRERQPGIRVLFMSGYTGDVALAQGLLEPGSAFIEKPFAPEALAERVRQVLDESVPRPTSTTSHR